MAIDGMIEPMAAMSPLVRSLAQAADKGREAASVLSLSLADLQKAILYAVEESEMGRPSLMYQLYCDVRDAVERGEAPQRIVLTADEYDRIVLDHAAHCALVGLEPGWGGFTLTEHRIPVLRWDAQLAKGSAVELE